MVGFTIPILYIKYLVGSKLQKYSGLFRIYVIFANIIRVESQKVITNKWERARVYLRDFFFDFFTRRAPINNRIDVNYWEAIIKIKKKTVISL